MHRFLHSCIKDNVFVNWFWIVACEAACTQKHKYEQWHTFHANQAEKLSPVLSFVHKRFVQFRNEDSVLLCILHFCVQLVSVFLSIKKKKASFCCVLSFLKQLFTNIAYTQIGSQCYVMSRDYMLTMLHDLNINTTELIQTKYPVTMSFHIVLWLIESIYSQIYINFMQHCCKKYNMTVSTIIITWKKQKLNILLSFPITAITELNKIMSKSHTFTEWQSHNMQ